MLRLKLLYVILLMISSSIVFAQQEKNYTIKQFTTENGMPSNGIKGLQWDETTGFLWIATEAGIVRYDGINLRTFTNENTPFITTERMSFLVRNHKGNIYAADGYSNIFRIYKNRLSPVNFNNSDIGGTSLISVSDILYQTSQKAFKQSEFFMINSTVASLSDTSFYIKTNNDFYYYSISMPHPVPFNINGTAVKKVFKVNDAVFITDSLFNIYQIQNRKAHAVSINNLRNTSAAINLYWDNGMNAPLLFEKGNVWLLSFDNAQLAAKLLFSNIPTDYYIQSAKYSESLNMLFIGTGSKGLTVFQTNKVNSKKQQSNNLQQKNAVYAQIALNNGNILTNEGYVIGDNPSKQTDLPIKGKFSFSTYIYNDTLLCYMKFNPKLKYTHLYTYNFVTQSTREYPKILVSDATGYASLNNKLYITTDSGIGIFEGDSLRYVKLFPKTKPANLIFQTIETKPGTLAIATCGGLFQYDASTGLLDTLLQKNNICVRSLWQYQDFLFIGTYGGGMFLYKNGTIKQLPSDKNKYLNYAHCFVPDGKGFCFISTNRGLFKASIAQMIYAFDHPDASVFYFYYGKNDGMDMTELNGGCTPCALKLSTSIISFPTMDGLLWVNPSKASTALPDGEIFIDEIIADEERFNADSIALQSLPAQTRVLTIKLALAAWSNAENIYIDYKLNNDAVWTPLNTDRNFEITFNNLPPGKYKLLIRKLNGFGIDNYTYKTIEFYITIPWYKQWWFYLICGIVLACIIIFYNRIRTRQILNRQRNLEKQVQEKTKALQSQNEILEKNNTIKTRLISIISHDIVTPLKFVTVAGKNLLEKRNLMPESLQQETLQEITNTSQELQLLSTNILNWIKYQNENRRMAKETFDVHEVVQQVQSILNTLAKQKNLQLINNVSPGVQVNQYFEPLKILVYNLLTNAIHFTAKGNITISSVEKDNGIVISVQDEGCGMPQEQIQNILEDRFVISAANVDNKKGHGLGYLIIKDLIKMMGASLKIESEVGVGTTVHIILPN